MIIISGLGSGKQSLPRFNNVPEIVNIELNVKNLQKLFIIVCNNYINQQEVLLRTLTD